MSNPLKFDLDGLRRAIESGDSRYLSALYADGAEVRIVDSEHPADAPQILRGRSAITSWIASSYARDDIHRVLESAADAEQVSLHEAGILMANEPVPMMIDQSPNATPRLAPQPVPLGTPVGRHVPGYYLG